MPAAPRPSAAPPPSRLKLAQLRLVAAIEDSGSVSGAAEALRLSQPAASRMIGELEAALGAPICERLARGVRLTAMGLALARHARSVVLQLAEAERELDDLKAGRRGSVAVGAVSGAAFDLLPEAVSRMREIAPEIEISVAIDSSNGLARDLLAGRLDFLLARVPEPFDAEAFDARAAGVEAARLVVRAGHPLLARGPADLADLSAWEWVAQPRGAPLRRALDGLFLSADLPPPRCVLATSSLTLTLMTIAKTDAVAALSLEVARFACEQMAPGGLALLATAFPLIVQPYALIRPRERPLSPAAAAVYAAVRNLANLRRR